MRAPPRRCGSSSLFPNGQVSVTALASSLERAVLGFLRSAIWDSCESTHRTGGFASDLGKLGDARTASRSFGPVLALRRKKCASA